MQNNNDNINSDNNNSNNNNDNNWQIDKSQDQAKCRRCSRVDNTINHIFSERSKLTQREYKRRLDWVGGRIHWEICWANGIHVKSKWYERQPEAVIENDSCKILLDFTVQTDYFITMAWHGFHW